LKASISVTGIEIETAPSIPKVPKLVAARTPGSAALAHHPRDALGHRGVEPATP
jgi:hypothetical protein